MRRRADASNRRAGRDVNRRLVDSTGNKEMELMNCEKEESIEETRASSSSTVEDAGHEQHTATCVSTHERNSSKKFLDPTTLTIDAFISVRRAWDAFIVFPQTRGASTIPPVHDAFSFERGECD